MKLDKSPETIRTMFNMIAEKYDFMNNIISFGTQRFIKYKCIENLDIQPHSNILDLCTGTGDLAKIIKKLYPLSTITGIDLSEKMIHIAKDKVRGVKFFQGDATELPFSDKTFDIVTMGFGLRNIQNPEKAIEQIYRVLKPNGLFLHLDFGEKNFLNKIFDKTVPILAKIFSKNTYAYSYLIKSKKTFLTPDDLINDFEKKGFVLQKRKEYLFKVISCQIMKKN